MQFLWILVFRSLKSFKSIRIPKHMRGQFSYSAPQAFYFNYGLLMSTFNINSGLILFYGILLTVIC